MKRRILAILMSSLIMCMLAVNCFAAIESADIAEITSNLSDFSVANVLTVLVAALGIAVPLILIWFAFRKIFAWAKAAFYGG